MKTFLTTSALVAGFALASTANAGGLPTKYVEPAPVYTPTYTTATVSAPAATTTTTTTAAVAAPVVAAASAGTEGLDITIGGFSDFQAGFVDHDAQNGSNDIEFRNDTEIHLAVEGSTDGGINYGAVVELEADVSADADGQGVNADKTYLFVESSAGRVELGNVDGAENRLAVNGGIISRATGGIDGDFGHFVTDGTNTLNNGLGNGLITTPGLVSQLRENVAEDATKISYYTPRFAGLQLGLSYTPEDGSAGQSLFNAETYENIISAGINYALDLDGIGVELSVTGEFGDAANNANDDLESYAVGLGFNFEGFQIAGSYGDLGNLDAITSPGVAANVEGEYYDAAIAFETGPFGVSVGYLASELGTNEFTNISVGADYELAPGLVPYVEVNFFEAEDGTGAGNTITDNEGTVVLVGTQLVF